MEIIKQEWFWDSAMPATFLLIGYILNSLFSIVNNYFKEKSKRTTKIKLEKLKTYKNIHFQAYTNLIEFISTAKLFYDPLENPKEGFIYVMKKYYFKKVKTHYPFYRKEIKEKIDILESQYICIGNSDFKPSIPFEKFYRDDYYKILKEIDSIIEKIFVEWEIN